MDVPSLLEDFQYHGTTQDDYGAWHTVFRDFVSPLPSPEEILIFKEELNNVYSSMSKLTDRDFVVFMMKHFDNYRISEISKHHNLTRSKIETSLKNTKKNVRQNLQRRGQLY
jgi:RNA polymerase sigma factor (sigma-70 family)